MNNGKSVGLEDLDEMTLPGKRFKAIKDHLYSEIKGDGVILSLNNGKYYGVNPVGARIWQAIQAPATLQELQTVITDEYDVDAETCRQEVWSFLEQMMNEGLVEILNERGT